MVDYSQQQSNQMKNYGNGILASSDRLASIAQRCLDQEREESRRRELIRAAFRDGQPVEQCQPTRWNISDRD
jgi:hypothetical protein